MTPAEFRSILEACGHGDDSDAARALGKSRSMIQKMKAGDAPVHDDVEAAVDALQDAYADARDAALAAAPETLDVWRSGKNRQGVDQNDVSWDATGRPARWHRMIAAECYQAHGTRIHYTDASKAERIGLPLRHDPMEMLG